VTLSLAGTVGLLLTFWLGFEEPNAWLLWTSVLTPAIPIGVLVHLLVTRTLTPERKRLWWKELASGQIWSALSEYLSSLDLAASADRMALESQARAGSPKT
jgi:hypothetical protein